MRWKEPRHCVEGGWEGPRLLARVKGEVWGGAEGKERVGEPGPGQGRWEMNWETFERQDTQSVVPVRLGTEREVSR